MEGYAGMFLGAMMGLAVMFLSFFFENVIVNEGGSSEQT